MFVSLNYEIKPIHNMVICYIPYQIAPIQGMLKTIVLWVIQTKPRYEDNFIWLASNNRIKYLPILQIVQLKIIQKTMSLWLVDSHDNI